MVQPFMFESMNQRLEHMLLTNHVFESTGVPFSG